MCDAFFRNMKNAVIKRPNYLVVIVVVVTTAFLLFEIALQRYKYPRTSKTNVCIVQSRDSVQPIDVDISNAKTIRDLTNVLKGSSNIDWSRYLSAANKAYALKHDYSYHIMSNDEYGKIAKKRFPNRNPSWWKLSMVKDVQSMFPKCQWVMYLDMKSYFYMDKHQTSLDHWISTTSIIETSHNYDHYNTVKRERKGYYAWKDQPVYFMVPLAGVYQEPTLGSPGIVGDVNSDYAKLNYFLVKNTVAGRKLMDDWINLPSRPDQPTTLIYEKYATAPNFEEGILSRVILPLHNAGTHFLSYRTFGLPDGLLLRSIHDEPADDHYWKSLVISLGLINGE